MGISRLLITLASNLDKTDYTLVAGSYSTRATSSQRGTRSFGSGDVNLGLTISAVSSLNQASHSTNQRADETTNQAVVLFTGVLTTTTAFDVVRGASGNPAVFAAEVWENLL